MTMPPPGEDGIHSLLGQVLAKQGEMQVTLAVISEQLKSNGDRLTDHEGRLRALERGRWPLPTVSVLAATGSGVAAWLAFLRH